jgi:hypothetical protein
MARVPQSIVKKLEPQSTVVARSRRVARREGLMAVGPA